VLAGYILQTNRLSAPALLVALSMGLLSLIEITASRPYKMLKRHMAANGTSEDEHATMKRFEVMLKSLSLGVMLLGIGLVLWRWSSSLSSP
jgi:hypothetical protein